MEAIGATTEMLRVLDTPLPETAETIETTDVINVREAGQQQPPADLRRDALILDEVSLQYPDGRVALTPINLRIAAGESVALVGPSGAGKSSLLKLILGFVQPSAGVIRIGDTPLTAWAREDWLKQLAWVPQQPQLFAGTIADNIRLSDPQAPMPAVEQAARQAFAHDFIQALPQGYDTPVAEAGQGLSGGQLQRIALARAWLRDAPLLLLDEATARIWMRRARGCSRPWMPCAASGQ
ncbi:MAG: ATP-binding cassette domain-containing protein [Thiolinea sp.]